MKYGRQLQGSQFDLFRFVLSLTALWKSSKIQQSTKYEILLHSSSNKTTVMVFFVDLVIIMFSQIFNNKIMIDVSSKIEQIAIIAPPPDIVSTNHGKVFPKHIKDSKPISIVLNSKKQLNEGDQDNTQQVQKRPKKLDLKTFRLFSDNNFQSSAPTAIEPHQSFLQTLRNIQRKNYETSNIKVMLKTEYSVIHNLIHRYFNFKFYNKEDQYQDIFLIWIDSYVSQEFVKRLKSHQRINHFPNSCQLGRKDLLALNLNFAKSSMPELYQFFPKTWVLPKDFEAFSQKTSSSFYIVKPHANCQGRGIYLSKYPSLTSKDQVIIQEYIENPMLIDGSKFDLRIYVMVRSLDPLRIYVYQEGLCRLATSKYCKPNENNFRNEKMHLTNYAINKLAPNFVGNSDIKNDNKGHKRSLTSAMKTVSEMGFNTKKILQRIDSIIIRSILAAYTKMLQSYKKSREINTSFKNIKEFMNLKQEHKFFNHDNTNQQSVCFEILGFDIMLLDTGEPILLEINHQPSLATDSPLDLTIKKCLVMDTINILSIDQNEKSLAQNNQKDNSFPRLRYIEERQMENRGGYRRIYPLTHLKFQNKSEEEMTQVLKCIDFYEDMINKIMFREFKRLSKLKIVNNKTITSRNNRTHISKQSQEDNRSNISTSKTSDTKKNSKFQNQKSVALKFYNLFSDTKNQISKNGSKKQEKKESQAELEQTIVKNHILLESIENSTKLQKELRNFQTIPKRQTDCLIDLKPRSKREEFYSRKQESQTNKLPQFFVQKEGHDFPEPSINEVDKITKIMRLNLLAIKNKGAIHYISNNKSKKGFQQRFRAQTTFVPTFSLTNNTVNTLNPAITKQKSEDSKNGNPFADADMLKTSDKKRQGMMVLSDHSSDYKEIYGNSIRQKMEKINNLKIIKNNLHKLNFINFVERTKGLRQVIRSVEVEAQQKQQST